MREAIKSKYEFHVMKGKDEKVVENLGKRWLHVSPPQDIHGFAAAHEDHLTLGGIIESLNSW